jgi:CubicO group peptidase (beta-lactamase class C family)
VIRGTVHDANAFALGGVAGHAGLFGTVADVAVLAREILTPERLALTAPGRARLLGMGNAAGGDRTVGWARARAARAARGILPDFAPGHTGFTGTSLWLDPTAHAFYLLLTNRVHPQVAATGFDTVRRAFHRAALRDRHGEAANPPLQ